MYVGQTGSRVVVYTPGKLNLSLEVLARRPDGYHEIETLMQAVAIFDTLDFTPTDGGEISLTCRWGLGLSAQSQADQAYGDLPAGEQNIVWRAVSRLRERAGIAQGASIHLLKRIPAAAGLGGALSDAAAALVAANRGWGLGWSHEKLAEVAAEIGSDVPFFLTRGTAICRGRGEQIEPLQRSARLSFVVVRPPVGLATPQVYQHCRPAEQPADIQPLRLALETQSGGGNRQEPS